MGIQKRDCYIVKCDFCGYELENGEGGTLCLSSKYEASRHIPVCDRLRKNGKLACPD